MNPLRALLLLASVGLVSSPPIGAAGPSHALRSRSQAARRLPRRRKEPRNATQAKVVRDRVLGGTHWRIEAAARVMHVWRPRGYRPGRVGLVIYVNGYRSSADKTWRSTGIAKQFFASHQNALFIVVDGPASPDEKVKFPALTEVVRLAQRYTRIRGFPRGHIVAIGHSAAYRTIVRWLDYRFLDHVVLVDALYAHGPEFRAWMTTHRHHDWHKLIVTSNDTLSQTEQFLKPFKRVSRVSRFPDSYAGFTRAQRRAPVLFIRSQYGHSELVNSGKVIPVLLRLTRLALLPVRRGSKKSAVQRAR